MGWNKDAVQILMFGHTSVHSVCSGVSVEKQQLQQEETEIKYWFVCVQHVNILTHGDEEVKLSSFHAIAIHFLRKCSRLV